MSTAQELIKNDLIKQLELESGVECLQTWDELMEEEAYEDDLRERLYDFLNGGFEETDLPTPYSRYYESTFVTTELSDGTIVGWIYWYGGGKHGEPYSPDWLDDAQILEVEEVEKLVKIRTYTVKEPS